MCSEPKLEYGVQFTLLWSVYVRLNSIDDSPRELRRLGAWRTLRERHFPSLLKSLLKRSFNVILWRHKIEGHVSLYILVLFITFFKPFAADLVMLIEDNMMIASLGNKLSGRGQTHTPQVRTLSNQLFQHIYTGKEKQHKMKHNQSSLLYRWSG